MNNLARVNLMKNFTKEGDHRREYEIEHPWNIRAGNDSAFFPSIDIKIKGIIMNNRKHMHLQLN